MNQRKWLNYIIRSIAEKKCPLFVESAGGVEPAASDSPGMSCFTGMELTPVLSFVLMLALPSLLVSDLLFKSSHLVPRAGNSRIQDPWARDPQKGVHS